MKTTLLPLLALALLLGGCAPKVESPERFIVTVTEKGTEKSEKPVQLTYKCIDFYSYRAKDPKTGLSVHAGMVIEMVANNETGRTSLSFNKDDFSWYVEQISANPKPKHEPIKLPTSADFLTLCRNMSIGILFIGGSSLFIFWLSTVIANACVRIKNRRWLVR
jgi:hypothetical protein